MRFVLAFALVLSAGARVAALAGGQSDVKSALAEGVRLERGGDARGALESYSWAAENAQAGSSDRGDALLALANVEAGLGKYADSARHAAEATRIFDALGDAAKAALALNRSGVTALYAGNYSEAERLLTLALERSTAIGDRNLRAEQLGNLANVQFFVGRYAESARFTQEALDIASASAAEPWAGRRRRILLSNQATLLLRLGRYQEALSVSSSLNTFNAS